MQRTTDPRKRPASHLVDLDDTRSALEEIFNWNPLPVVSKKKATSKSTRQPAPYDRHMDETLRLKRVVYAPHMLEKMPTVVDEYLQIRDLPDWTTGGFRSVQQIVPDDEEDIRVFSTEAEVVTRYASLIAGNLVRVASTLALGLPNWYPSYFVWSRASETNDVAIGDGFLRASSTSRSSNAQALDPSKRDTLESLEKNFPNIGVWEFKSTVSGLDNLDADARVKNIVVYAQAGVEFKWVECSSTGCGSHYQPNGDVTVTGARVGYDARTKRCTLPEHAQVGTGARAPKNIKGTVYILQQAWAEAVREDATFIIIHSGNFEVVCFRDRKSNTLYISPVINIPKFPKYGKLKIGIYLTMYLDAVERNELIVAATSTNSAPAKWLRRYNVFTFVEKEAQKQAKKITSEAPTRPLKEIAADAHSLPALTLIMRPSKQRMMRFFLGTIRFDRVGCDPAVTAVPPMQLDVGDQIDNFVYDATLKVHGSTLNQELIVKIALNKGDSKRLLHEIQMYELLNKTVDGMPDVFGGFVCDKDDPGTQIVILVMKKHGISLLSAGFRGLTILDRTRFMAVLNNIHKAGYLHGHLTKGKLLFQYDSVKIVGLGRSTPIVQPQGTIQAESWPMDEDSQVTNESEPMDEDDSVTGENAVGDSAVEPATKSLITGPEAEFKSLQKILNRVEAGLIEATARKATKRPRYDPYSSASVGRTLKIESSALWGPMDPEDIQPLIKSLQAHIDVDTTLPRPQKLEQAHTHFLHLHFLDRDDAERFVTIGTESLLRTSRLPLNLLEIPVQHFPRYTFVSSSCSTLKREVLMASNDSQGVKITPAMSSGDRLVEGNDTEEELRKLFDLHPLELKNSPKWIPSQPPNPFWFYDKHVDPKLSLLHVKHMHSLLDNISSTTDLTLHTLKTNGIDLPLIDGDSRFIIAKDRDVYPPIVTNARSVAELYERSVAQYCLPVASTLAIHPNAPDWMSVLRWNKDYDPPLPSPASAAEHFSLRIKFSPITGKVHMVSDLMASMDELAVEKLQEVSDRCSDLGTWEFGTVSEKSEGLLRGMSSVMKSDFFTPEICDTRGYAPSKVSIEPPPDAKLGPCVVTTHTTRAAIVDQNPPRRSARLTSINTVSRKQRISEATRTKKKPSRQSNILITPGVDFDASSVVFPTLPTDYSVLTSERLLQHAWNRSVEKDTTIIVFNCGNFERIGIRHRKSQTLFLSDIVDVAHGNDPAYGKLQIGIYISAIQDAYDRAPQLREVALNMSSNSRSSKKQAHDEQNDEEQTPRESDESTINSSILSSTEIDMILRAAGKRNLALVRIQHGVYNSPAPASFIRAGRSLSPELGSTKVPRIMRKYGTTEYITVILHSKIGKGATGVLYNSTLQVYTTKMGLSSHEIVVKIAFEAEQQSRIRHEYDIYDHLASSGVEGYIPRVYGLFEDIEGGATALLMNHAGEMLWKDDPFGEAGDFKAPPHIRTAFLSAMKTIHKAGVRHRDIRPYNLLVNDADEVSIIDFDRAVFEARKNLQRREYKMLESLLDGNYIPPDSDFPASEHDSSSSKSTSSKSSSSEFESTLEVFAE